MDDIFDRETEDQLRQKYGVDGLREKRSKEAKKIEKAEKDGFADLFPCFFAFLQTEGARGFHPKESPRGYGNMLQSHIDKRQSHLDMVRIDLDAGDDDDDDETKAKKLTTKLAVFDRRFGHRAKVRKVIDNRATEKSFTILIELCPSHY